MMTKPFNNLKENFNKYGKSLSYSIIALVIYILILGAFGFFGEGISVVFINTLFIVLKYIGAIAGLLLILIVPIRIQQAKELRIKKAAELEEKIKFFKARQKEKEIEDTVKKVSSLTNEDYYE